MAVLMENNRAYLEVLWAAQRSGLHYTAINRHLRPGEVQYVLDDCGATTLVSSEAMRDVVAGLDLSAITTRVCASGQLDGFERYDDLIEASTPGAVSDELEGREMLYSSGTTGRPKGVRKALPLTPLGDPTSAPVQIAQGIGMFGGGPDAVYLSPAPLYHTAPVVFSSMVHRVGGTVVVLERWDPTACLEAIQRYRVTTAQFVPTMFVRLLKLPPEVRASYDVSSLRLVSHAAAPCPVEVKRQVIEWLGPIVWEYYAGSENVGSTMVGPDEWLEHPGTVGMPRMTTVHICDDDHNELPIGEVGNIWFETPGAGFEYHGDPDKTAKSRSPEGWFNLGDVGYLDHDGYLYLTDRQSFTIISGGVNIYPQETEDVLVMHPAVADVAVFGVPNDEFGEEVKAVVQLLDPERAGPEMEAELLTFCREHLAAFKCPRSIDFDGALPRQDTGKLYKRLLKDRYWGDRTSRIV